MVKKLTTGSFLGTQLSTCRKSQNWSTSVAVLWSQWVRLWLLVMQTSKVLPSDLIFFFVLAHCVTLSKSARVISSDNVLVYMGKTSLQKWQGHEQDAKVADIVVNEEYDPERFYGDIAVLKLKQRLERTNFVRPVCLWSFDSDLKNIVDKLGSVPGW